MNRFHVSIDRFVRCVLCSFALVLVFAAIPAAAQQSSRPDSLVLKNGDTLHGKFVTALNGKVTFHTDALGDVQIPWDQVKELHTAGEFAVVDKSVKARKKKQALQVPIGTLDVQNQSVQVSGANAPATIPVSNAAYIIDEPTLDQQVNHEPSFFAGWNGAATAGATIVAATQNQYTASGSVGLVRVVPGVTWLAPRNRTSTDFSGSFGKISQPGTPTIKTAIFHADAERDEYFSRRFFGLAQVAFDHNFAQALALQSQYGAGIGFTAISNPTQQLDFKATVQYESQQFLTTATTTGATPTQHLIGSMFSTNYVAKLKFATFAQQSAFIPAYNRPSAYSANETNALTFPVYKNFGFSIGTLDSYLNDPPTSVPPTKRNSFQFTMGVTYNIKSNY